MSVAVITLALDVSHCQHYPSPVARWEPDARGRLEQAAFTLYAERGFENTTVAEIAERAGVTERTFFRHFTDKREVLFSGAGQFQETLVSAVINASPALAPMEAVAVGLQAISEVIPNRDFARQRQTIITANAELRERELIKLASLGAALADALRQRGIGDPAAGLAAEAGVAVFRIAFERWVSEPGQPELPELVRDSLGELQELTAARPVSPIG